MASNGMIHTVFHPQDESILMMKLHHWTGRLSETAKELSACELIVSACLGFLVQSNMIVEHS